PAPTAPAPTAPAPTAPADDCLRSAARSEVVQEFLRPPALPQTIVQLRSLAAGALHRPTATGAATPAATALTASVATLGVLAGPGPVTGIAATAAATAAGTAAATATATATTAPGTTAATAIAPATTAATAGTAPPGLAEVLDLLGVQPGARALGPGQPTGDVLGDVQVGVHVRGGGVGLRRLAQTQVQGAVDEHPARHVVPVHERDRGAGVAGPTGTADAVHLRLLVLRAPGAHHARDDVDVDAAGGHVGGDQHVHLAVPERAQCLLPGPLAEVAVDRCGSEPAIVQLVGHLGAGALGAGEDDRQPAALRLQDPGEQLHLVH